MSKKMKQYRTVLIFIVFLYYYAQAGNYSITNSLERLNLPEINHKETPFTNVVSQLNKHLEKNNLPTITVDLSLPKISINTNASTYAKEANAHIRQFLKKYSSQTIPPYPITFTAQRISMFETLKLVADLSGLNLYISDKNIVMRPGPSQFECEAFRIRYVGPNQVLWIETTVHQPWAQCIVPNTQVALLIDTPERLQRLRKSKFFKEALSKDGHN